MRNRCHPAIGPYLSDLRAGRMHRREFLTRATSLGLAAGIARALAGPDAGGASAQTGPPDNGAAPVRGGTLRVQMAVHPLKDTRAYDWSELGNLTRGWFDYLMLYENDGSFSPMLLESWDTNADATEYVLRLRDGITWSNGDPLTAEDIAWNVDRWCDASAPGNSMPARLSPLMDPTTGRARGDAITVVDARTVRLRLASPDISLIPGISDYPAAIVHPSFDPADPLACPGTGPYRVTEHVAADRCILTRTDRPWWGTPIFGGPWLDRIEYLDFGSDPASWSDALRAGQVDLLHETVGRFVDELDGMDVARSEIITGATIVARPNQLAEQGGRRIYADRDVRRALQLAVDNAVILEIGYGDHGIVARNDHVAPVHPEWADLPPEPADPKRARDLMVRAGLGGYEHELISIDDDWRRFSADAVAAQLRDAGIPVKRTILPVARYLEGWAEFPFSVTNWNHRPLGVQVLSLAYRSGTTWNEFGWSDARFDAALDRALSIEDADARRDTMREIQSIVREEGVAIQPYWRTLYRHMRRGLVGTEQHMAFEHHHFRWAWTRLPEETSEQ